MVIPERRSAEVTPAVCKASAGAVEHLPVARVRNLADWLGCEGAPEAWVYGAAADGSCVYDRPDYRGGWCWCSGARGGACARALPRPATSSSRLPNRGKIGSLNVSTAAAALVYGILHFRKQDLDRDP